MRASTAILLTCLLLVNAEGIAIVPKRRCLCIGPGVNFVRPKNIKTVRVYYPTTFCDKMEILVTQNDNVKKCLNTMTEFAKTLIRNLQRSKRKGKSLKGA
ncbi:C-X-C motif chemokine 11-like [Arapaima gigas]